jgi:uncharacterized protein (TIGR02996 family)
VTESQLVADVIASPDDDAPRLVYADWLQERGDPRGELIALQCELARADAADERPGRTRPLRARVAELIAAHHAVWLDPLFEICAGYYELRRGFVEHLAIMQHEIDAVRLHAAAPLLREVAIPHEYVAELPALASAIAITHLTVDGAARYRLHPEKLGRLRRLDLARCGEAMIPGSFELLPELEHLGLHVALEAPLDRVAELLMRVRVGPRVRSFAFGPFTKLRPQELFRFEQLRKLMLTGPVRELAALAIAQPHLTSLGLVDCGFPLKMAELVGRLPELRHLRIVGSFVTDAAAEAIAHAAPKLARLDLSHNKLTVAGAYRLVELLPGLVELRLRDNAFAPDELAGLRSERGEVTELVL